MKYLLIASLIFIQSCSILSDVKYSNMLGDSILYYCDFGEIESHEDISRYINKNVTYARTPEIQNPEKTINIGYGECLDKAILYMNIAYYKLGIETSLICVDTRTIVNGGLVDHAEVYYNGDCYSVYTGQIIYIGIGYIYGFDEVFKR